MEIVVRPMEHTDIRIVHNIRLQEGNLPNLNSVPSDTLVNSEEFFTTADPASCHFYVAEVREGYEARVVGCASLTIPSRIRQRHSALIGIMVDERWHGRGVGRALMGSLVDLADNWLGLVRLELDVFADNERALRLYRSMGFVHEGTKAKATMRSGKYEDLAIMARIRTHTQ